MTLFSASRGAHLLFIVVGPDYFILLWVGRSTAQLTCYFPSLSRYPFSSSWWSGANERKVPCPSTDFDPWTFRTISEHSTTEPRCLSRKFNSSTGHIIQNLQKTYTKLNREEEVLELLYFARLADIVLVDLHFWGDQSLWSSSAYS